MAIHEENQLLFEWGGLSLAGSLHLPGGAEPHAAVLLAQGSGPADRDSGGYFEPIRQTFLDRGIATFAFDKPGCGMSSGDWRQFGLNGRAEQIVAALDLLRNHPAIAGEQVGIWGHSQGGWLVQMLAGRPIELAFAIAGSAPAIGVADQILYDCEQAMRDRGCDDDAVQHALSLTRALHKAAFDGVDFESISAQLLEPASHHEWYEGYPTIDDADEWQHATLLISEHFEPLKAMSRIECPFLAVYGGLDALLPPWQGAEQSGHAVAEAPSSDATVVVFPRGDHRLQEAETGDFVDGYLELLGDWTSRRTG